MNTNLRKKAKNDFEKSFLNAFFGKLWKIWENIEKLNFSQTEGEMNCLVSKPNYHTTKFFTDRYAKKQRYFLINLSM